MLNWKVLAAAVALAALGATSAQAQAQARLNQIGRHIGRAAVCERFGFELHEDQIEALANRTVDFGVRSGFPDTVAYTYIKDGMDQAAKEAQQDIEAMSAVSQEEEARFVANIQNQARKIISACRAAADDPSAYVIITAPSESDEILVRNFADAILTPTGLASWQTPYMRAGADLIHAVAACATHLTRAQSDTYVAELYAPNRFTAAVKDNARAYFDFWKQKGREGMAELDLDATQCNSLLTERAAKLKAAR